MVSDFFWFFHLQIYIIVYQNSIFILFFYFIRQKHTDLTYFNDFIVLPYSILFSLKNYNFTSNTIARSASSVREGKNAHFCISSPASRLQ